jgi:hypothetical protein
MTGKGLARWLNDHSRRYPRNRFRMQNDYRDFLFDISQSFQKTDLYKIRTGQSKHNFAKARINRSWGL